MNVCEWNKTNLQLVTANLTGLTLNTTAWAALNIPKGDPSFKCYYNSLNRFGEAIFFESSITVSDEMVEVVCTLNDTIIYLDYHIFIRPAASTVTRKDGQISLLILGMSSMSAVNFQRQMPKTNAFLSQLDDIVMLGYNKVEDSDFPNILPVLSGRSVNEFRNSQCWPKDRPRFDDCHFLWNDFKKAHFSTVFIEDCPSLGMFTVDKGEFSKDPTDHYLKPILQKSERLLGNGYRNNTCNCCTGHKLTLQVVLDYTLKIALSMSERLYMNFVWSSSLTRDFVEYARYGDDVLRDFFNKLHKSGELNNTVVVLLSDQGVRYGKFRETYQGGLEERLPMLRFIVPDWFQRMYPKAMENLSENSRRLTTPFDLYETLLELVDTKRLGDESIESSAKIVWHERRGTSLFLPIPESRTCQTAGIPKWHCACYGTKTKLSIDDANAVLAVDAFVNYTNLLLANHKVCANLKIHQVHRVTVELASDDASAQYYDVQVTMVPGNGTFEIILKKVGDQFSIASSINRVSEPHNQSYCVTNHELKSICYCLEKQP